MEYTNQIQELTERSVSGCASGCIHWLRSDSRSQRSQCSRF